MEWKASCKKTLPITVERTVRHMAENVVGKANQAYSIDPPLNVNDMVTNYYPEG